MLINVKKSGLWAFHDIWVEHITEGLQEMRDDKAKHLLDNGRADLPEAEPVAEVIEKEVIAPIVKKEKSGWWSVTFAGHEEIKVRGADDEEEAIVLATAKLEVK